jgi:hypothetical protein
MRGVDQVLPGFVQDVLLHELAGRFARQLAADAVQVDRCNSQIVGQLRYIVGTTCLPDTLLKLPEILRM